MATVNFDGIHHSPTTLRDSSCMTPMVYGGGGWKKSLGLVVSVVAAIAIPFVAPTIAATIFGAGSVMGGAVVGAGLGGLAGAASGALSGRDIFKSALVGAAGGALAGGIGAAGQGASLFGNGMTAAPGVANPAIAAAPGADPWSTIAGGSLRTATAGAAGAAGGAAGGVTAGLNTAGVAGAAPTTTTVNGVATPMSKITDSLLKMAPQLVGQAAAAMGGDEKAAYMAQLEKEMQSLKGKDEAAYQQRMQIYQQFMAEAANTDSTYEAKIAQAEVKRNQSKQSQQRQDVLNTGTANTAVLDAEARRFSVEAPLTQYAAGVQARGAADKQRAGLLAQAGSAIPDANGRGLGYTQRMYQMAQAENDAVAEGASSMTSQLLLPHLSNYKLGAPDPNQKSMYS